MQKEIRRKQLIVFITAVSVVLSFFSKGIDAKVSPPVSYDEVQSMLEGISDEEKEVLRKLLKISNEIEETERTQKQIAEELEIKIIEISVLEKKISQEEAAYKSKQDFLKRVFKSYQRIGPVSYLDVIFSAESLSELLRGINTLRDLTRNTQKVLYELSESKEILIFEKDNLNGAIRTAGEKKIELAASLEEQKRLKTELEEYLQSLGEKRDYYEEYLSGIRDTLGSLKSLFEGVSDSLSRALDDISILTNYFKISFSFSGLKGTIDEESFNNIIKEKTELPEMIFSFKEGEVEMNMPEKQLVLHGTMLIKDGSAMIYEVQKGTYYNMLLGKAVIEEVFSEGLLLFDFEPLLAGGTINGVNVKEGYVEVFIK